MSHNGCQKGGKMKARGFIFMALIAVIAGCAAGKEGMSAGSENVEIRPAQKNQIPEWVTEYGLVPPGCVSFFHNEIFLAKCMTPESHLLNFFDKQMKEAGFSPQNRISVKTSTSLQFRKKDLQGDKKVQYVVITVDIQNQSGGASYIRYGISKIELDKGREVQ